KPMNPLETTRIGHTDLWVTRLGLGGGPLGEVVSNEQAVATVEEALRLGVRYIDTAPLYGLGRSEIRIGGGIPTPAPRDLVISTKVGRLIKQKDESTPGSQTRSEAVFDYSHEGVLR